ncbi:MAG TPA: SDR family oxidoreductase [bacterium]|nr:SDR family oxidoreductase [bacterium]
MAKGRFEDKVVLVTGGTSGIGLATAHRLISEGAQVVITGRDEEKLKRAAQALGPKAEAVQTDISKVEEVEALYARMGGKYGRLNGLFANAGIALFEPLDKVTENAVDAQMDTNFKGTFFTVQKAIPLFTPGASVVLNASVAGTKVRPPAVIYGATKAAVRLMAKGFSINLVEKGVRVNVISPGPIRTPIWDDGKADAAALERIRQANPSKRFGTPEEIAGAVAYLLSDESAYIAGEELFVDGGYTNL